ncbi:MAG: hypothetical protein ACE5JC_11255 [Candidatus Zixiibacteriota bacterium]
MDEDQAAETPWYEHVIPRERHNLLNILVELSHLFEQKGESFIIIGAFSLLIRGVLTYTVLWDLDLLFKDRESMDKFIEAPKSPEVEIEHLDEELMVGKTISSLHTAWRFTGNWFNVDYILLPGDFDFYRSNPEEEITLKSKVTFEGKSYRLSLPVATPWDVIVKKLLSPRLERELESRDSLSMDVRHVFHLLLKFGEEPTFWRMVVEKANYLGQFQKVKTNLLRLLSSKEEVGYGEFNLGENLSELISAL